MKRNMIAVYAGIILILGMLPLAAQSGDFDLDLNMGVEFNRDTSTEENLTALGLSLKPDISVGKWGFGLIGTLNFALSLDSEEEKIRFMKEDWVPEFAPDADFLAKTKTLAGMYIPIFRYVRYGWKGEPLYAQFGTIDSITLGTGVFVDQYRNTELYQHKRISGAVLDMDGRLFSFPYVGFESFVSNIVEFDVMGARVYSRPLSFLDVPVVKDIQIGGSFISDTKPAALDDVMAGIYSDYSGFTDPEDIQSASMYGADVIIPLAPFTLFSMDLFGDLAYQLPRTGAENEETASAVRAGARGRIGGLVNYSAALTAPKNGYIPNYFDSSYDAERKVKYDNDGLFDDKYYLNASAGFDLFDENLVFDLRIGSEVNKEDFSLIDGTPNMEAYFRLGEDIMPFFYFDAYYRKTALSSADFSSFVNDVLSPTANAEIEIDANIQYSIIKTSLGITVTYGADGGKPDIRTSIAGDLTLDKLFGFL